MSEMVERLARVMSVNDCEGDETAWADDYGPEDAYKEAYRKSARVVLGAMYEPTDAMIEAGNNMRLTHGGNVTDIWRAMVAAARA